MGRHARPRSIATTAIAVMVTTTLALPAQAAAPQRQSLVDPVAETHPDACGVGDDLVVTGHYDIAITTYVDRHGTPTRVIEHIKGSAVWERPATGDEVTDAGHYTVVFDLADGTATLTGLAYAITVPGSGIVAHDTGRIIVDPESMEPLWWAGPHEVMFGLVDPAAAICAATE